MEPFDDPPTWLLGWVCTSCLSSVFVLGANMCDIRVLFDYLFCFVSHIGGIQTQILRSFLAWHWTRNHDAIQGRFPQPGVMNIGTIYRNREGQSMSLTQLAPLGSTFSAIGGIGSGRASA